jgi:hypothetical protein
MSRRRLVLHGLTTLSDERVSTSAASQRIANMTGPADEGVAPSRLLGIEVGTVRTDLERSEL